VAELPDDFADLPPELREELLGCAPADRARIAAAYRAPRTHVTDQSQASTVGYQARAAAAGAAEQAAREEHARTRADIDAKEAAIRAAFDPIIEQRDQERARHRRLAGLLAQQPRDYPAIAETLGMPADTGVDVLLAELRRRYGLS
jgi:hypothetical protein